MPVQYVWLLCGYRKSFLYKLYIAFGICRYMPKRLAVVWLSVLILNEKMDKEDPIRCNCR